MNIFPSYTPSQRGYYISTILITFQSFQIGRFEKIPNNSKDECWSISNSSNLKYPQTLQNVVNLSKIKTNKKYCNATY